MNLTGRQCRATRRHHIRHAGLVHRHDIGVSLHEEAPLLLHNGGLGQMHAIQHLGLVVQDAFRRIEILRNFFVRGQRSPPEPNDTTCDVPNRKHHSTFEKVPDRAVLPLFAKPGFDEFLRWIARLLGSRGKGVP